MYTPKFKNTHASYSIDHENCSDDINKQMYVKEEKEWDDEI